MDQIIRKQLIETAKAFSPLKMLVAGDLMLDQYIWGKVERISPEAPIPVLRVEKEEFRLGGAANVAANLKALDCEPLLVGIAGRDIGGNRIRQILEESEISDRGVVFSESFQTVIKQRVLTSEQHLLRIDYEAPAPAEALVYESRLWDKIKAIIDEVDGVILSDYAKGTLSENLIKQIVDKARKHNLPIIVDPAKGADFSNYYGVTALKPNRNEIERAAKIKITGQKSILKAAAVLLEKCRADFLAVSLDKDGILLFRGAEDYQFIETEVKEVYDVTGAGDIVVSIIAALLAKGIPAELGVHMANIAAELEISRMGVVPIKWSEILKRLVNVSLDKKISGLEKTLNDLRRGPDAPLIFTNGYFDNISAGHLRFLVEVSKIPGRLIVAVNSDSSIIRRKGSPPLLKEFDRARLLASLSNVYRVIIFDGDDASGLIRSLKPQVIVKGENFKNRELPEQQAIGEVGAEIKYIPRFSWPEAERPD